MHPVIKTYLGIDVSKLTIDCCLISGSLFFEQRFENSKIGFKALLEWLKQHNAENLHCCMEATGVYHEALAAFLADRFLVSVCNPRKIKGYAVAVLQRSKTDRQDARLIAQYCKAMNPQVWQASTVEEKQLQELTRYIGRIKQQRASEQTKLQTAPACICHHIKATIDYFSSLIVKLEKELKDFYRVNSVYKANHERLKTISGIGDNAASVLLANLANGQRFEKSSQFVAYLGLDPRLRKSGTSVNGRPSISKLGKADCRAALFMPAMVAYRDNAFPDFVANLKRNGKRPKQIIVAIMRKLAVIAFTLHKNQQDFDKSRYK